MTNNKLIDNIAGLNSHTPLLESLATYIFFDASRFPVPAKMAEGWVLLLSHSPLKHAKIHAIDTIIPLPFGHIYPLFCSGLDIGYLIELPPQYIIIQRNVVSSVRRRAVKVDMFSDVKMLFKNKDLTVFGSGDSALLIGINKISLYSMRRSKGKRI